MNHEIMFLKQEPAIMCFVKFDPHITRIIIMTEAELAANADHTSQIGIVLVVTDIMKHCKIR